ncbi:MAG: hypothetical protein ACI845_004402 [Gammaproteobacteria bacterium]|jgi:hypothetical protein
MPAKQFGVLVAMEPVVAAIVGVLALTQIIDVTLRLSIILVCLAALLRSLTTQSIVLPPELYISTQPKLTVSRLSRLQYYLGV